MGSRHNIRSLARKSALTVAVAAAISVPAVATAATVQGNGSADIVQAISISEAAALDFGSAIADAGAAGTVVMDAAGNRTCNTVTCVTQDAGAAGSFTVTGEASYTYDVVLPTSATLSDGGTNSMTVDTFTHNSTGTLDGTGQETFGVGATLNVDMGQVAGNYNGTFDVTVNYQ